MKVTELRVGNIVGHKDGTWFEVKVETFQSPLFWSSIEGLYNGVPITEEWLLNFGFEREIMGLVSFSQKDEKQLKYKFKKELFFVYLINGSFGIGLHDVWDGLSIELKHVHHLQNLYFDLTGGEELAIKEFEKEK